MSAPVQQFKSQADVVSRDLRHREFIQTALNNYAVVRDKNRNAFRNYPAARQAAVMAGIANLDADRAGIEVGLIAPA